MPIFTAVFFPPGMQGVICRGLAATRLILILFVNRAAPALFTVLKSLNSASSRTIRHIT